MLVTLSGPRLGEEQVFWYAHFFRAPKRSSRCFKLLRSDLRRYQALMLCYFVGVLSMHCNWYDPVLVTNHLKLCPVFKRKVIGVNI